MARTLEQAIDAASMVEVTYDARPPKAVLEDNLGEVYLPPPGRDGPNEIVRGDPAGK